MLRQQSMLFRPIFQTQFVYKCSKKIADEKKNSLPQNCREVFISSSVPTYAHCICVKKMSWKNILYYRKMRQNCCLYNDFRQTNTVDLQLIFILILYQCGEIAKHKLPRVKLKGAWTFRHDMSVYCKHRSIYV